MLISFAISFNLKKLIPIEEEVVSHKQKVSKDSNLPLRIQIDTTHQRVKDNILNNPLDFIDDIEETTLSPK